MKKILVILLIFSLSTFVLSDNEDNDDFNFTTEDVKKLQDLISKVLPVIKDILNEYKDVDSVEGQLIYDILDRIYSVLDLLSPLLDKDPQTFMMAMVEVGAKLNKLKNYFQEIVADVPIDSLLNAAFKIIFDKKFLKFLESAKDDFFYFLKKQMDEDDYMYYDIVYELYPYFINLLELDDFQEFIKKSVLILLYNSEDHSHFSKEYDVQALGKEVKQIYNELKNNDNFKQIVVTITEDIIDTFMTMFIDAVINNDFSIFHKDDDDSDDDY